MPCEIRRYSFEDPYWALNSWVGMTNLLTKKLERIVAEICLHMLANNFRDDGRARHHRMVDPIRACAHFMRRFGLSWTLCLRGRLNMSRSAYGRHSVSGQSRNN